MEVVPSEHQEVPQPVGQLGRPQSAAAQVFPDHHSAQVRQRARVTWRPQGDAGWKVLTGCLQ